MKPKHSFKCNPIDWCEEHQTSLHECAARHSVFGYTNPRERELEAEIERLKAEKDQMYQLGRSIEIERDNLKAEVERLKAELRIWQECSARQDHELDDLARKLEQAEAKLERAQAVIDSYYGCEIEPRMAAFLREFRAALATAKVTDGPAICAEENDRRRR